ncbi:extracellular solute-binding protein [Paenibacillus sp. NPDC056579]|uniref:extracellular solute-binding protein n=1 Tax=Paenibacillus sp. NPDC056579 TaxID=3345871 RepID=UPI003679AB3F
MKRIDPEPWEKLLTGSPVRQGEAGFSKEIMRKIKERVEVRERPRSRRWLIMGPVLAVCCAMLIVGLWKQEELGGMLAQLSKPMEPVALKPMDRQTEMTLKVAYFHENTFMMNYGKAFTIRYPNMSVQVIPTETNGNQALDKEKLLELIDKENPDVLYMSSELYGELAKEGRLYPLDAVMKQDRYDLQSLYSGMTGTLRELGGGKLYGLAPTYEMEALYYNKELFDKFGIPYPNDKMSWEEVLLLAARFPAGGKPEERIYGLLANYYGSPSALAARIGKTKGISLLSPDGKQATVNTEGWKNVWSMAIGGFQQGFIYQPQPRPQRSMMMEEMYKENPFITGKAAMTLSSFSLAGDLKEAVSRYKMSSFPWDIVTEPVDPARPNESSSFFMGGVYAVSAKSEHLRPAWEMIKLINSPEIMKKQSKSFGGGGLTVRLQEIKPDEEHHYAPFYTMKPAEQPDSALHPRVLRKFNEAFTPLSAQKAKAVMEGSIKLDEGLKQLQEDAQRALFEAMLDSRN